MTKYCESPPLTARKMCGFSVLVSRGEAGAKSDVDLLVKLEPGRSLLDVIAIKQDLEDLLGREVDVVTEDAVSTYIREQVLKEAINL